MEAEIAAHHRYRPVSASDDSLALAMVAAQKDMGIIGNRVIHSRFLAQDLQRPGTE